MRQIAEAPRKMCPRCKIFLPDTYDTCPQCRGELEDACPNDKPCTHQNVAGIKVCEICGEFICPICGGHNVQPVSRITGYMSPVNAWNKAKREELKNRVRNDV